MARLEVATVRFLLLSLLAIGSSCSGEAGDLRVLLRTDLPPETGFSSATVEVFAAAAAPLGRQTVEAAELVARDGAEAIMDGTELATFAALEDGDYTVRVTLASDAGIRATRTVPLTVVGSTELTVSILATCRASEGDSCDDTSAATCSGGSCSASGCACPAVDATCASDADCPSPVGCGIGECRGGECFITGASGACGVEEFCDPVGGCLPLVVMPPESGDCADVSADPMALHDCTIDATTGMSSGCAGAPITLSLGGAGERQRASIDLTGASTLEVIFGACDAEDYTLHIGDSPTNDGHGGDAGTTDFDAELMVRDTTLLLYANDTVGSGLSQRVFDFLPATGCALRRVVIRDREVELPDLETSFTDDPGLFRFDTTAGAEDALIYLGLNGVLNGRPDRAGTGARCARLRIYE